tara:strand:- start:74 stop:493 length:420 start_codon:yes stop_codon:yes gene_type:complete
MKIMGRGPNGLIERHFVGVGMSPMVWRPRDDDKPRDSLSEPGFFDQTVGKVFDFLSGRGKPLRDPGSEWMDADVEGIGTVVAFSRQELDVAIDRYIDSIPNCVKVWPMRKNFSNEFWMGPIPDEEQRWWADIHYHRNKK